MFKRNPPTAYIPHEGSAYDNQGNNSTSQPGSSIIQFVSHQRVEVFVSTNVWVAGVVMAIIRACNQFSGARYRIRYTDEGGNIKEGEFPQEVIRAPRGAE